MVSLGSAARVLFKAASISLAVPSKKRPQPEMKSVSLQRSTQYSVSGVHVQTNSSLHLPGEDVALVLCLVLYEEANVILSVARCVQRGHVQVSNLELVLVLELYHNNKSQPMRSSGRH